MRTVIYKEENARDTRKRQFVSCATCKRSVKQRTKLIDASTTMDINDVERKQLHENNEESEKDYMYEKQDRDKEEEMKEVEKKDEKDKEETNDEKDKEVEEEDEKDEEEDEKEEEEDEDEEEDEKDMKEKEGEKEAGDEKENEEEEESDEDEKEDEKEEESDEDEKEDEKEEEIDEDEEKEKKKGKTEKKKEQKKHSAASCDGKSKAPYKELQIFVYRETANKTMKAHKKIIHLLRDVDYRLDDLLEGEEIIMIPNDQLKKELHIKIKF